MTEQLKQHRIAPDRNETVERLSIERQAETFFKSAIADGRRLSQVRFEAPDEAHEVGSEFVETQMAAATEVRGLDGLTLRVTGAGVRVANIDVQYDEQGRVVADFSAESPVLEPAVSYDVYGQFRGIVSLPLEHDDGTHGSMPYFILQNQRAHSIAASTQYGFPLVTLMIESRVMVACDGTATVELPALDAFQSRSAAIAELAIRHHDKPGLVRTINDLSEAMHSEDDEAFTTLKKVDYLHTIGRAMAEETEKADDRSEVIATAAREVLGRGHVVGVRYRVGEEGDPAAMDEARGTVLDILAKNPYVPFVGPALVLGCPDGKGGETLRYVPLDHIETFQF